MLSCDLRAASSLDSACMDAMYRLMEQHYAATTRAQFTADLSGKDWVLILRDPAGAIQGFSTLQVLCMEHESVQCRVLYSGDTVIDRAHWGEQELAFNWLRLAGALHAERPDLRHYWFLISKGHRTYRYLPTFAKHFLPHWSQIADSFESSLLHRLSQERFGEDYRRESGVVSFANSRGHLREDLAEVSERERRLVPVRYFLQRNPGYRQGDELCCLCELVPANLRPLARRLFLAGAQDGLVQLSSAKGDACPA
jgi:hypothetical protein